MDWAQRLNRAIDRIEENLHENPDYEGLARSAMCSSYHFQRMFAAIAGVSVSEYVRRRRMTQAAFDLRRGDKVIDVALRYGYETPESFARAFQAVCGIAPSAVKRSGVYARAYPRIAFQLTLKGDTAMDYAIRNEEAFTVYGIEGIFSTVNEANLKDIPSFWQEKSENGEIERLIKSTGGAENADGLMPVNSICDYRQVEGENLFPYMLYALKTGESDTTGYTVVEVPASTWAIFRTERHDIEETSGAIQELIRRVYADWLPTAAYEKIDGYELELYFMDADGRYYEETWIRVRGK